MKFSQTLLNAYACPRRGKLLSEELEKHGKRPGTGPALVGSAVHGYMEEVIRSLLEGRDITAGVRSRLATQYGLGSDTDDFNQIIDNLQDFVEVDGDRVLIEEELSIGDIVGTPDYIQVCGDHCHIHDWKTTRRVWTIAEAKKKIQLPFYALLFELTQPETIEMYRLTYWFLRYNTARDFYMSADEVRAFGSQVRQMIDQIKSMEKHPPIAGEACDWCEFVVGCPLSLDDPPKVIATQEQAQEAAEKLLVMQKAIKEYQSKLKTYVEGHGPVEVGDQVLGFASTAKVTYPNSRLVIDTMYNYDVDPDDAIKVVCATKTSVDKLKKKYPDAHEAVSGLAITSESSRFGFKKKEN